MVIREDDPVAAPIREADTSDSMVIVGVHMIHDLGPCTPVHGHAMPLWCGIAYGQPHVDHASGMINDHG